MGSAYFISQGMVSMLAITEDGQTVDICTVGKEGVVGLPMVLNVPIMPCRVVTQLPCEALMIKGSQLLAEFNRGSSKTITEIHICPAVSDHSDGCLSLIAYHSAETVSLVIGHQRKCSIRDLQRHSRTHRQHAGAST